ncbi:hypothetical protein D3C76_1339890 [compost metagenome]
MTVRRAASRKPFSTAWPFTVIISPKPLPVRVWIPSNSFPPAIPGVPTRPMATRCFSCACCRPAMAATAVCAVLRNCSTGSKSSGWRPPPRVRQQRRQALRNCRGRCKSALRACRRAGSTRLKSSTGWGCCIASGMKPRHWLTPGLHCCRPWRASAVGAACP